jgi:hypothetical protein
VAHPPPLARPPQGFFGRTIEKVSDRFGGFGSSKLGSVMEAGSLEDLDAYYERLGTFTGLYARHIFSRMAKTVPKAIILCQVIRSRDRLLDQLYNYLMGLKPFEIDALLAEDPSVVKRCAAAAPQPGRRRAAWRRAGGGGRACRPSRCCWVWRGRANKPSACDSLTARHPSHTQCRRRNAAQQAARELAEAQAEVRTVQEVRASAGPRPDPTSLLSVRALLLAGAFPLIPPDKVPKSVRNPAALYGEFTPVTLLQGLGEASAVQLGSAAVKAGRLAGRESNGSESGATENGSADGGRPGSAQPAPSPSAATAAKPRRQPPPPPPKMP